MIESNDNGTNEELSSIDERLNSLTANELFELAEKRRLEEERARIEASKEQVAQLRGQIRQLEIQYKKERNDLERQISKLTGRPAQSYEKSGGVSKKIVEIVQQHGEISVKEINAKLIESGIAPKNLTQSMAYLKKRGEVFSIGHGLYASKAPEGHVIDADNQQTLN